MPRTERVRQADIDIGHRLRTFRNAVGMSQTDLGEKLGISFQQIQKYEKGANRLSGSRLTQIAEILGIPAHRLLGEGEPDSEHPIWTLVSPRGALELLVLYGRMTLRQRQLLTDLAIEIAPAEESGADDGPEPAETQGVPMLGTP